jgi:hypothetical protein
MTTIALIIIGIFTAILVIWALYVLFTILSKKSSGNNSNGNNPKNLNGYMKELVFEKSKTPVLVSPYIELLKKSSGDELFDSISKKISEEESIELCRIPKDSTVRNMVDNYLIYTIKSKIDLSSPSSFNNNKALVYLSKFTQDLSGSINRLPDWIDDNQRVFESIDQRVSHQMDHIFMSLFLIQHFPTLKGRIMDSIRDHPEYQQCYEIVKPLLKDLPQIPISTNDYEDVMHHYMRSKI